MDYLEIARTALYAAGRRLTKLIFEEVTKDRDEGWALEVVYMDFCKVFDKVHHDRLM